MPRKGALFLIRGRMKMRIAVVDADLIGREKHRFPNLASMKLSAYYKGLGYDVDLYN